MTSAALMVALLIVAQTIANAALLTARVVAAKTAASAALLGALANAAQKERFVATPQLPAEMRAQAPFLRGAAVNFGLALVLLTRTPSSARMASEQFSFIAASSAIKATNRLC